MHGTLVRKGKFPSKSIWIHINHSISIEFNWNHTFTFTIKLIICPSVVCSCLLILPCSRTFSFTVAVFLSLSLLLDLQLFFWTQCVFSPRQIDATSTSTVQQCFGISMLYAREQHAAVWQIACKTFVTKTVSKLGKLNFQVSVATTLAFTYELLADILNPISNHLNFKCGQAVGWLRTFASLSLFVRVCVFRRCTCLTWLKFHTSLCIINASSNLSLFCHRMRP